MTEASNRHEQDAIWTQKVRPVLLHPLLVRILGSPVFLWNGLGVPINQVSWQKRRGARGKRADDADIWSLGFGAQMNCFLEDGSVKDFL